MTGRSLRSFADAVFKTFITNESLFNTFCAHSHFFQYSLFETYKRNMVAPSLILLALFIQQTNSYLYSCNPSAACGCSTNSALVNRIVGGEAANSSVWGWIVSIYIAPGFLCGGSILSSTWVLTAAHCLDTTNASQVLVFAGSNAVWSGQSRSVSRMILHAGYNSGTKENDIALLELDTPLNMTDSNVRIACLPSVSSSIYTSGEWPSANQYVSNLS